MFLFGFLRLSLPVKFNLNLCGSLVLLFSVFIKSTFNRNNNHHKNHNNNSNNNHNDDDNDNDNDDDYDNNNDDENDNHNDDENKTITQKFYE